MSKDKKRLLIVVTVVFLCFAVMTYQYSVKGNIHLRFLSYPFDFFNALSTGIRVSVKNFFNTYEDNHKLREQLNTLYIERQQYGEVLQENKRLRELLGFSDQRLTVVTTARIVGRSYDRVLHMMIIDKGANSGIKKDMAVITIKGLLGKIYAVNDTFSEVLLLKDPNFSVSARIQDNRVEGVLSGTGYNYVYLNYIPPEENVEKGNVIVTSGLDGLFPPGIPIGVVQSVNKDNVEFFQHIKVIPFQYDTKVEEAMVIADLKR